MLRRLTPIITIFLLVFFSTIFATKVYADPSPTPTQATVKELDDAATPNGGLDAALKEFCNKRSGNQMNLETWYSGKCTDDTFSGEGVGFSDIVILDLAEKISGKKDPNQTFSQTLKGAFDTIKENDPTSLNTARQNFFASQTGGLLSQGGTLIATLYQYQPASTKSYLAYVSNNLQKHKVIPSALAASNGVGFETFSPFLPIWIAVRNLAYLALVVFFIVYGFMMMFRVNLGQKTVISIQLAIPKLIVTLLIITFSYAIVGLVFDLMYVVIYFVFSYLGSQNLIVNGPKWNPAKAASGFGAVGMIGSMIINSVVAIPATTIGVLNLVLGGLGTATGIAIFFIPGVQVLIPLVIFIAVLISYGKLFVKLIGSFISIIVSLITAPIVLLGNAFPGSSAVGNWFRSIVANVAVFPTTIVLLAFSYMFMIQPVVGLCTDITSAFKDAFNLPDGEGLHVCEQFFGVKSLVVLGNINVHNIPLIGPNAIGGFSGRSILALLGVGLLLMAAKYVDIVKDALKVPPFKYGAAIGDALKGGWKNAGLVPGVGDNMAYQKISEVAGLKPGNPITKPPAKSTPELPEHE